MVLKENTEKTRKSDSKQKLSGDEKSKTKKTGDHKKNGVDAETGGTGTDQTDALKEALAAEKDRVLRVSAEFENFKKRKQKEIDDFRKFANESLFRQLLNVVDNLERAIASAEDDGIDPKDLAEGVKLTHKEILKMFETFNVRPIAAESKPFDPNFHQAVTQMESEAHPENTVISELQKGYLLHDRLLRPSMVVVSKKTETEKESKENNENK